MLARALSQGVTGAVSFPVNIEVYAANGLPAMEIIGLPDASVRESRDRVGAAVVNSGFAMPIARITVNLAPADQRKEGPFYDLPIALCVLLASGQLPPMDLTKIMIMGELSLDGTVHGVRGALPTVIAAREQGIEAMMIPADNAEEVACIQGIRVYPVHSLREAVQHLTGEALIPAQIQRTYDEILRDQTVDMDLSQVKGQLAARRALEIAAAGGHNMLMIGVPGSGKTMLARCLPGILPEMTLDESLESTKIHSIAGNVHPGDGLIVRRPFRTPHHSASLASLVGGGAAALPGEVSLAHNGVLFLDELPEFDRRALEALRQPLEDGVVNVTRVKNQATYQARFMLIASMNPCPCGYFGSKTRHCRCTPPEIQRYLNRISGPLLDRIDLQIEVDTVPVEDIARSEASESSATVRERVRKARQLQLARYREMHVFCNAQLNSRQLDQFCAMTPEAARLLQAVMSRKGLSMRAVGRIRKVARTIADLAGDEQVSTAHLGEAIQYRELDEKYWKQ